MTESGGSPLEPSEYSMSTPESSATIGSLTGIRRQRASYSCRNCRARRVKCDQVHPTCDNCKKNGLICVFPENAPKRIQNLSDSPGEPRVARRRVEGGAQPRLGYLSLQSGGRSRYLENTFWATVDEENLELDSLVSELPLFPQDSYCCATTQTPHGEKKQHIAGCRHFARTVEPNLAHWVADSGAEGELTCRTLGKVLEELPPKPTCDTMYAAFLEGVHPLVPLLHLPSFDEHYRQFWTWYENWNQENVPEGVLAETPTFLPLLFAILFTAAFTSTGFDVAEKTDQTYAESPHTKFYRLTLSTLALVGFPQNPAIYSLTAFLLAQNMLIREEESLSSSSYISVAFRIAQAMGIHRDGSLFRLNPVQTEVRRRIWWHLMHTDVMVSTVSGLPPFILNEGYFDTQLVGELKDELIGQRREGPNKDNDNFWFWPPYVLTVGRYQATDCIRSILRRQFALVPITSKDVKSLRESIEQLSGRLEDRMTTLKSLCVEEQSPFDPSELSRMPRLFRSGSQTIEAFLGWSEAIFNILIGRAYCLLYQPLMRDSTLWEEFRNEAIPKIQAFMRTYIGMCNTPLFRPFQWLYPGTFQPLQQTAALLIDMRKNPMSPDARESRVLLDMLFSLLGPEGRITTGESGSQRHFSGTSRGAWSLLDKLRKKVWRQLGLDPSIMWSRGLSEASEDQEVVHIEGEGVARDKDLLQTPMMNSFFDSAASVAFDPFQCFTGTPNFGAPFMPATDPNFLNNVTDMNAVLGELGPQVPETWGTVDWTGAGWPNQQGGFSQP